MKDGFGRFFAADPGRLHAAAHSHHPWPDVSFDAHVRAWDDAARLADDKWDHVFGTVLPQARRRVAAVLDLPDPESLVFAPNTHEFVVRIASTLPTPFTVLTTDSEFHSFTRQLARWEEAGIARTTRVPAEPFESFPERLAGAYSGQDLVFFSHVHFNSGYVVPDLAGLVAQIPAASVVVVDGYHGFMAVPTSLAEVSGRAFYLAGGYKYAMAGEGACFLHVPPTSLDVRPVNTGWWAGYEGLTGHADDVAYSPGGQRFGGATADPSGIYRLEAVLAWLEETGVTVADIHSHVAALQSRLLDALDPGLVATLLPEDVGDRGHFLTFRRADAAEIYTRLHADGVITDYRADRWRVGLGIYHDDADIDRLAGKINAAVS